ETLRTVDAIASEDTRKTGRLLKHFDIQKQQIAFHEHNEYRAGQKLIAMLEAGQSIALVTNAGTPGISDPGFTLVRRALEADIEVTVIPGPTALIMALVMSGLPVHSFTFRGFAPRKSGQRRNFMAIDADSPHTLIFYESPHRVKGFLADALAVFGDRSAALASELTKLHEQMQRASLSELVARFEENNALRGEYTIVIAGKGSKV
ncbi:MAG: 16S rRNA (cytidine(1402)-2'-O)-methyltransferase, partial [Okeania sp. SIO3B3]|nr:16S rRNA (cytidine(1402)-2'-O)-methyltransferase [Okeania sp. SIO3B3]